MSSDAEQRIAGALRERTLVPVVGAGFSAATARLPGWPGLIMSGFDYVEELSTWPDGTVAAARAAFHTDDAASLIAGARRLKELLGAPHGQFPAWLERQLTVDHERCSLQLLNAVADLLAPVVGTTNYDKLLSMFHPNPTPVTWRDPAAMAGLFRGRERRVFHFHGVYDRADTVVFGADDYDALVGDVAYRAVLQTLWLDRTLLFIGCSLDGLQDPDFVRFLEWTTKTFPGLTHQHYALARTGDVTPELRRRLLHDCRVLVLDYGATHDLLPGWIANVNPNRAEALDLRRARTRELLETGDLIDFAATLSGLSTTRTFTSIAAYAESARPLFEQHARSLTRERNELAALQRLARQMVSEVDVRAALNLWDERHVHSDWELFYNTALAAGDVLFVFERRVLARLWRLEAGVHTYSATGELRSDLDHARHHPDAAKYDKYTQENLARILRSVVGIFDADPVALFPAPTAGRRIPSDAEALVVLRTDGVELRALHDPETVMGALPETPPTMQGVDAASIRGVPALIAYNSERITAWDPYRVDIPIAVFRLDELPLDAQDLLGIYHVAHRETDAGLVSSVIIGSQVHWLLDLAWVGSTDVSDKGVLQQVWLSNNELFAVGGSGDRVIRIDRDGARLVFRGDDLLAWLRGMPTDLPEDLRLDNMRIQAVEVDGRPVLGVRGRLRNGTFGSVIALVDPVTEPPTLVGAWTTPKRVTVDFTSSTDDDGSTLLFACCLRDYNDDELHDLVHCARGVRTSRGLMFVEERSGVPAEQDLFDVIVTSGMAGFVAETSGKVFRFDLASGNHSQIGESRQLKGLGRFPPRAR